MPELSFYVKQLLEEDEFGTYFHSQIDERVKELNLNQLSKMSAHLEETAANAEFKIWREANEIVHGHFGGYLEIRAEEKKQRDKEQRDLERKVAARRAKKAALKREREKAMDFIEKHCAKVAADQIIAEEKERKSQERVRIRTLVYQNERLRGRWLAAAFFLVVAGVVMAVLVAKDNLLLLVAIIGSAVLVALAIVAFTFLVTRLEVTDVHPKELKRMIEQRTQELKFQTETDLLKKEEEFQRQQLVEREESRVRRRALREQRELERQIREMDRAERRLQLGGLDSQHSMFTDSSVDPSLARSATTASVAQAQAQAQRGRLPPVPHHPPRPPHAHGSVATLGTTGLDTHAGTLGSGDVVDDSGTAPRPSRAGHGGDDDDDDDESNDSDYGDPAEQVGGESLISFGGPHSQSQSTLGTLGGASSSLFNRAGSMSMSSSGLGLGLPARHNVSFHGDSSVDVIDYDGMEMRQVLEEGDEDEEDDSGDGDGSHSSDYDSSDSDDSSESDYSSSSSDDYSYSDESETDSEREEAQGRARVHGDDNV
jgi:hypothetical protein